MIAARYTKLAAIGNIKDSDGMLHWLIITNSHSSNVRDVHLNDATSGAGSEVMKIKVKPDSTLPLYFDPPIPFATGIRIGTMGGDVQLTGGYS